MPEVTVHCRGVALRVEAAGPSFLTWFKICVWDLLWVITAGASQRLILLSFAVALGVAVSSVSRLCESAFVWGLF